jgi:UDP-2,4-diacetamido-2,4,6-trideoxy-beta-L-altropyranose hydrolase
MVAVMRKILFRVDAGPKIGLGHLQRCLSLATALRHFNTGCFFLTNEEQTLRDRVKRFGFDGRTLGAIEPWGTDDLTQTMAVAAAHKCGAIVVDSDYEGVEYLSQLRNAGYYVVAIEDTAPHPFPCQLVVNGDAHARQLPYQAISEDTRFLLGPEYSILRREFWDVPPRVISENVDRILVTLGGADPYNIMPRVINELDTLPEAFSISVIVGPFFENFSQVQVAAQRAQRGITLVKSPDSVRDLMMEADLAVSAGGQTLYELARVGCATVAVRMASNQDGQLAAFEEFGFLRIVGYAEHGGIVEAIGSAVRTLLADSEARAAMSVAGKSLIDGQGALRVAQTIVAERVRVQGSR